MRFGLLLTLLLCGCAGVTQATAKDGAEPHVGEAWFRFRAEGLGITVEEAKQRDASLSEEAPPEEPFWDDQTRLEAAVLWRDLCARCHGPGGDPEEARVKLKEPPRSWTGMGPAMGFFFGGDGMRAGIYRRIAAGGDEEGRPSRMPAWGEQLSREQIWALVRHIEGF